MIPRQELSWFLEGAVKGLLVALVTVSAGLGIGACEFEARKERVSAPGVEATETSSPKVEAVIEPTFSKCSLRRVRVPGGWLYVDGCDKPSVFVPEPAGGCP